MTHGPTFPGGSASQPGRFCPPTPTPRNIPGNWGHFGCYNLGGGCCWCSGGTSQAGCSMPAARRTVHTKDYLTQKVHSADREKPCPQVARGPFVRRTLPGLLTFSGAGSLVQSSPLPSDETRLLLIPHPPGGSLCPARLLLLPPARCSSPRCSHCLPLPCCRSLLREPFLATSSQASCFFFLAPLPLDPFLPFSLEWDAFVQRTLPLVLFPA